MGIKRIVKSPLSVVHRQILTLFPGFFDRRLFKPIWKSFGVQFGEVIENFRRHKENVEREAGLSHMIEVADERMAQRDERAVAFRRRKAEDKEKRGAYSSMLCL